MRLTQLPHSLILLLLATPVVCLKHEDDPARFVNMFIGTAASGHSFPGATVPNGAVKVGPDTNSPNRHAGYVAEPEFKVTGFSQLHESGTGGQPPLSNFKVFPLASCTSFKKCKVHIGSRAELRKLLPNGTPDDYGEPGYFSTNLSSDVRAELTATKRTALHRYTFPKNTTMPRLVFDFNNDGQNSGNTIEVDFNNKTGRVTVGGTFLVSFGPGTYRAYACFDVRGEGYDAGAPLQNAYWPADFDNPTFPGLFAKRLALQEYNRDPKGAETRLLVRIGISLKSSQQACASAEEEIPDFNFEKVKQDSRKSWNEILSRVQVDTTHVDADTVTLLYSSLYRTFVLPADFTGQNPDWNSTEPYYDSFYCNWDTYRTLYSVYAMVNPFEFARIVRGMIDIQKHEGWLPECRSTTKQQFIQGGSNADPILSELYVKLGDKASELNINATALYDALLADAEKEPPNWNLQGRQTTEWIQYGFIPTDSKNFNGMNTRWVSRSLEYGFNDFTISQVAKLLGKVEDGKKYAERAKNYTLHWNPNVTVEGRPDILGMMQIRKLDGSFIYTEPRHCSPSDPTHSTCYLDGRNFDGFYEGSPLVYSQYVPHDTAKLVELQGGNEKFSDRIKYIIDSGALTVDNEPSQQIPFQFHYADRPGLSTQYSRKTTMQYFSTATDGVPGNDDSGAMASYVFFHLAGMYPLPGTYQVLISSPFFPLISFQNPLYGTTTTIKTTNFQGNPKSGVGRVYIKSVKIDGKPWKSNCWISWNLFKQNSTVELELTDDVNVSCGTDKDSLPPSLSNGGYELGAYTWEPFNTTPRPPKVEAPSPVASSPTSNTTTGTPTTAGDGSSLDTEVIPERISNLAGKVFYVTLSFIRSSMLFGF